MVTEANSRVEVWILGSRNVGHVDPLISMHTVLIASVIAKNPIISGRGNKSLITTTRKAGYRKDRVTVIEGFLRSNKILPINLNSRASVESF